MSSVVSVSLRSIRAPVHTGDYVLVQLRAVYCGYSDGEGAWDEGRCGHEECVAQRDVI